MKNKKGDKKTIVIGVIVLIIIVAGIYLYSTKTDVPKVDNAAATELCQAACDSGDRYEYCTLERRVVFGDDRDKEDNIKYTCDSLIGAVEEYIGCPAITCSNPENCQEMGDEYDLLERNELEDGAALVCPTDTTKVTSVDTTPMAGEEVQAICCKGTILDDPAE